jgi:hypothetical protein
VNSQLATPSRALAAKVPRFLLAALVAVASTVAGPASPAAAAPNNDHVSGAFTMQSNSARTDTNVGGTMQFQESNNAVCGNIGKTVWYRWTAPQDGRLNVVTVGPTTTFDTIIDIYEGPSNAQFFNELSLRNCDDNVSGSLSTRSATAHSVGGGRTFYLRVGGKFNAASGTHAEGTFKIQLSFHSFTARDCGNVSHFFAVACTTAPSTVAGARAAWNSDPLNITQDGANAGGWIQEAIWLYNNPNSNNYSYLEILDSGGTGFGMGNNKPYLWERWWAWIDGYTNAGQGGAATGTYTKNFMARAAADGAHRHYVIKRQSGSTWSLQICNVQDVCTPVATSGAWLAPGEFIQPRALTGMEVSAIVFNDNTNTGTATFESDTMQLMNTSGIWGPWTSHQSDVDNPCTLVIRGFCLNGFMAGTNDNWRNNKP